MVAITSNKKIFGRLLFAIVVVGVLIFIFQNTSFFQTSVDAFTTRFDNANEAEGGIKGVFLDRVLGGLISALLFNENPIPYFGYGIGLGTNVGAMLTTGTTGFLISEGEWGRIVGEMGFILGIIIIILRTTLGLDLLKAAFKEISKKNLLPWMLMSGTFMAILQGQFAQPTSLGFAVLMGGLVIASLKHGQSINNNI